MVFDDYYTAKANIFCRLLCNKMRRIDSTVIDQINGVGDKA